MAEKEEGFERLDPSEVERDERGRVVEEDAGDDEVAGEEVDDTVNPVQ